MLFELENPSPNFRPTIAGLENHFVNQPEISASIFDLKELFYDVQYFIEDNFPHKSGNKDYQRGLISSARSIIEQMDLVLNLIQGHLNKELE